MGWITYEVRIVFTLNIKSSIELNNDSLEVYLSEDISNALREILLTEIMKNKTFMERLKEKNRKVFKVINKKPIIFAASIATITQGVISLLKGRGDTNEDLPPSWPPI